MHGAHRCTLFTQHPFRALHLAHHDLYLQFTLSTLLTMHFTNFCKLLVFCGGTIIFINMNVPDVMDGIKRSKSLTRGNAHCAHSGKIVFGPVSKGQSSRLLVLGNRLPD